MSEESTELVQLLRENLEKYHVMIANLKDKIVQINASKIANKPPVTETVNEDPLAEEECVLGKGK